jgi:hypothetical protein
MWTRVKLGQMYKDAGETSNSTAKKRLREQKLKEHEKAWDEALLAILPS